MSLMDVIFVGIYFMKPAGGGDGLQDGEDLPGFFVTDKHDPFIRPEMDPFGRPEADPFIRPQMDLIARPVTGTARRYK